MKKVYGVIGDPIGHSMSPDIHNDAFENLGIDAVYLPFHVLPANLSDAVKGMKAIGVAGFNVTVPHKTTIIPYLDEVDELAAAIGAVNTVLLKNDRYIGYNTDGAGFYMSLVDKLGTRLSEKKILVIGAGGSARAIYFTLVKEGTHTVDIANRTIERAEALIADCRFEKSSFALSLSEAEQSLEKYDVIVQTTSSGMSPEIEAMPLSLTKLKKETFVSDIIYNPLETKLLQEASMKGASVQNGVSMLANQAALAFELWTGTLPDTTRMQQIIWDKLGGNTC
jgi:shikimate dehydrogenase